MAKRTTQEEIQRLYEKEYKRIQKAMNKASGRGYIFSYEFRQSLEKYSPTITDLKRVEKIKGEALFNRAVYFDPLKDTYISGKARRQQERRLSAQKAAATRYAKRLIDSGATPTATADDVYNNVWDVLNTWQADVSTKDFFRGVYEHNANIVANYLTAKEREFGRALVSYRLQKANETENVADLARGAIYSSTDENFHANFRPLMDILEGRRLTAKEARMLNPELFE